MPIYEYRCEKCGKVFEVLQRFSDDPVKIHEECGGPVEKLISHSAFQLKGSGWYASDYAKSSAPAPAAKSDGKAEGAASDSKPAEGKSETASESKSDSKSESKSDSKAETKTESKPVVSTTAKND
jgi:putative FmdB family regulatory protein